MTRGATAVLAESLLGAASHGRVQRSPVPASLSLAPLEAVP